MQKTAETSGYILFSEQQKYPGWIKWIVLGAMGLMVLGLALAIATSKERADLLIGLAAVLPVMVLSFYLLGRFRLDTVVSSNGIYFRCRPFQSKFRLIEDEDISSVSRTHFPFPSYGMGWSPGYGRYYRLNRGEGMQIYLKDGNKFFFSTLDPLSFERAVTHLVSSTVNYR